METQIETTFLNTVLRPFRRATFAVIVFVIICIGWATTAKLATTIHVSGSLVSSQPQYEIQHAYGGKLKSVFVKQHDQVSRNQPTFELDVVLQRESLAEIEKQIEFFSTENAVLAFFLKEYTDAKALVELPKSPILDFYKAKHEQVMTKVDNSRKAALSLSKQAALKKVSLKLLKERRDITLQRLKDFQDLASKGVVTTTQKEDYADRLMNLSSQINEGTADITALEDQLRQTKLQQKQYHAEFHLELSRKLVSNEQSLPELHRRALVLKDEIENSVIRSPISGIITELSFATNQMQVPKGGTLAIISRTLVDPVVHVTIPTSSIDQVTTGMKGLLTLSSLPQRNLSRVTAEVVAISPDVSLDASGLPTGYKAIAKIDEEQLVSALSSLNVGLQLSSGMPVSLALEGRRVTFSQYLIAPFFKIFQGALQD